MPTAIGVFGVGNRRGVDFNWAFRPTIACCCVHTKRTPICFISFRLRPWVFKISLRCASGGVGLVVRCGQLRLVYECQAALRRPIGIIDLHAHTCSEFNFVRMDRTQCTYQQCRRGIDDGDENVAYVGDHHHDAHSTRACSHTRTQTPGQAQVKHL